MISAKPDKLEILLLLAFAAILSLQLFIPPTIGLADNGDFGKVYTHFLLAHANGDTDNFAYFSPKYWFVPERAWRSDVLSSEILLAVPPVWLAHVLRLGAFDLRWLGAVQASLLLVAFYFLLLALRPVGGWRRLAIVAAAMWMFGDVAYVAYCNSFYSDTAAVLGAMLAVPLAILLVSQKMWRPDALFLFAIAALLFISSKSQHAVLGCVLATGVAWIFRQKMLAALLLGAMLLTMAMTPASYRAKPLFNLIFHKIAAGSRTPLADLRELGLGEQDLRYVGMTSYSPEGPGGDAAWMDEFLRRTGSGAVCRFYLRHPIRALKILAADLRLQAFQIRPEGLGNFPREYGRPPGSLTGRFASWSRIRGALFIRWPWHIVVWFVVFVAGCLVLVRRRRLAAIGLLLAGAALAEFAVASLGDSVETYRHLLLFHLFTDMTLLMGAAWAMSVLGHTRQALAVRGASR